MLEPILVILLYLFFKAFFSYDSNIGSMYFLTMMAASSGVMVSALVLAWRRRYFWLLVKG